MSEYKSGDELTEIKAGDELKIVFGATGKDSHIYVNGQELKNASWVELRTAGKEVTTIKLGLELCGLGEPIVYEGRFEPLVEP
jgi:hypothetical protein